MSVANKIFTNTFWQLVIRVVNILIGVFSLALITRMLGSAGFGYYTTIFAFVQIFAILADLGLYITLLREISSVKDKQTEDKITSNIFTIRLVFSVGILLLIPIAIQFFPYEKIVKEGVIYFMGVFFFQSLISTLTAIFSKYLAMPKVAMVDFVNKIVYLAFLIYFFSNNSSLNQMLIANVLSMALSFVFLLLFLKKYTKLNLAWDFKYWRLIFYRTWPLAVTVVLNLLYFKADTLVLSIYSSPEEVGVYGAPYRVLEVISTFPHMFMSLILPFFTASFLAKKYKELNQTFQYSFDFFSIITVAMTLLTLLISRPLMTLLAGEDFAASGPVLDILIIATAGIFFGTLFTYMVVAIGVQKQMIKYFLIAAIFGLVGYFIFIPRYSYWGAAYMTLFVEWLIVYFSWLVVKKNVPLKINLKVLGKSILAGALVFVLFLFLTDMGIILRFLLASFLYVLILYFLRAVNKDQLRQIFINR